MKDKYVVYEYTEKASPEYVGSRFMTVWDKHLNEDEVPDNIKIIKQDVSQKEGEELCDEKLNNSIRAFFNSIPNELKTKEYNTFIKNMLFGL